MRMANRKGDPARLSLTRDTVSVYPSALDVLSIVVSYKNVRMRQQLKISDIREKVWLHDRDDPRGRHPVGLGAIGHVDPADQLGGTLARRITGHFRTIADVSQGP